MGVVTAYTWLSFLIPLVVGNLLGRLARRSWRLKQEPPLDKIVLDTAIGLGLLSLVIFAMAATHVLRAVSDLYMSMGVVFFASVMLALWTIDWLKRKQWPSWKTVVWVFLFICLGVVILIPAMAPPSGSDWDSLAYHLSVPSSYAGYGGFYYMRSFSHSNFPMLVEMLYTPALSMREPSGAKMMHYLYGVLLVLAVVMLVRKHFPEHPEPVEGRSGRTKAAPLAALAIAGMPIVMWEATTGYIDLATALYTVVAVYLLLDYLDKPEPKSLLWCGVAAGFAASTKMTGLALIPMLVVWLVIDRWFTGKRIEWKPALTLAAVGLAVCSPWYIKSLIYTGNPVYPFFYSVFGGKDWTQELAQNYTLMQGKFGMGHGIIYFLRLPLDLLYDSDKFYDRPGLFIGPIVILGVVMIAAAGLMRVFSRPESRKLKGLTVFFFAQMVIWFALTQQSRYLIPAFAILAVIIAAVAYSDQRFRLARVPLYIVFGMTALFGVFIMSFMVADTAPVVFGSEATDHYLARTLPVYSAEQWINDYTPRKSTIALFGDTRGFYLERKYYWADWGHNAKFTRNYASVDDFVSYLKRQGMTHAMVNFGIPGLRTKQEATGTYAMIYGAIEQRRFIQVFPGPNDHSMTAVFEIR